MRSLPLVAVLAACTSIPDERDANRPEDSPDGDGNDNGDNPAGADLLPAKEVFDTRVYPVLVASCSGGACHSQTATSPLATRFVADDAQRGWQTATNFTAVVGNHTASSAPVLTIVAAGHLGIVYTAAEKAAIVEWLEAEAELRNGQDPPIPDAETLSEATERARREFVACMTLENFEAANVPQATATLTSRTYQQCVSCHAAGEAGFMATAEPGTLFTALTTRPALLVQYYAADLTQGAAAAKLVLNDRSMRGVANNLDPHREHPSFNADLNPARLALTDFYNRTVARKAAGNCNLSTATLVD